MTNDPIDEVIQAYLDHVEEGTPEPSLDHLGPEDRQLAADIIDSMNAGRGINPYQSRPSYAALEAATQADAHAEAPANLGLTLDAIRDDVTAMRTMITAAALIALTLVGCGTSGAANAGSTTTTAPTSTTTTEAVTTTTAPVTTTTTAPTTTTTAPPSYPSGAPVVAGYPVVVDVTSIDYRVASWYKDSSTTKAVALAPGVYAPYNPAVSDPAAYLAGPVDGDCAVIQQYFPDAGSTCWGGVQAGSQEPH